MSAPTNKRLREQLAKIGTDVLNFGVGWAAGNAGMVGDIASWLEKDSVIEEVNELQDAEGLSQFSSERIGEFMGADPNNPAFQAGTFGNPRDLALGLVKGGAAAVKATKATLIGVTGFERLVFRGMRSATTLSDAKKYLAEGMTNRQIFERTGWILDPVDGQWKFQLPHWTDATINQNIIRSAKQGQRSTVHLGTLLDYPELYEAYPSLSRMPIRFTVRSGIRGSGEARFTGSDMELWGRTDEFKELLVHEIEHYVQDVEGFAPGGSPLRAPDGDYVNFFTEQYARVVNELADTQFTIDVLDIARNIPPAEYRMPPTFHRKLREAGIEIGDVEKVENIRLQLVQFGNNIPEWDKYLDTLEIQHAIRTQKYTLFQDIADRLKTTTNATAMENIVRNDFYTSYRALAGEAWARTAQDLQYKYEMGMIDDMDDPYPFDALDETLQTEASLGQPELTRNQLTVSDYLNPMQRSNEHRLRRVEAQRRANMEEIVNIAKKLEEEGGASILTEE